MRKMCKEQISILLTVDIRYSSPSGRAYIIKNALSDCQQVSTVGSDTIDGTYSSTPKKAKLQEQAK
jgi:hypothetical protein